MANKIRGEVRVRLNGTDDLTLRPTFEALAEVEERTGRGVIRILADISNGDLRLKDTVEIVHACAIEDVSHHDVATGVMGTGLIEFVRPVSELLMGALGGNPKEGEKDPSPGTEPGN